MNNSVSVLLVGIGGYGQNYVRELLTNTVRDDYHITGIVDPHADKSSLVNMVKEKGIPVYKSMEEFYQDKRADYVCIASPIQFHARQTIKALENGATVLCEKPLAPTIQEAHEMLRAQEAVGKEVGIAYQWSFSKAIQSLKKDIIEGVLGKPRRLKTVVLWPRDYKYYNRNNWAGKIKDSSGQWILDSVASNATAHYLHNMFYVLGRKIEDSALPLSLEAELYRANKIENYDTIAARIISEDNVELLFLATHASRENIDPMFSYEFEKGTVCFDQNKDQLITARFRDGREKIYGNPFDGPFEKIWIMLDAARDQKPAPCGIKATFSHLMAVNGIQEAAEIVDFPENLLRYLRDEEGNESAVFVEGLSEVLLKAYKEWKLPHELGVDWRRKQENLCLLIMSAFQKRGNKYIKNTQTNTIFKLDIDIFSILQCVHSNIGVQFVDVFCF